MAVEKVLIIDDELLIRQFLVESLSRRGIDVSTADSGKAGLALVRDNAFDIVFTDMKMPDMTGLEVLKKIKEISPTTIVVVVTAFGSIENAVDAMRLGAFNYLIKPFTADTIEAVIEKTRDHLSLVQENQYLRQQVAGEGAKDHFAVMTESPAMKAVMKDVLRVAPSNASVFISGESGTGKEVISHVLHYNSLRANRPFIKVNCAAVPDTLIESEFFGHEKGAFTGAHTKRCGRFELANGGTLLLDEITEIPLPLQAKLLRAIQEQEFERVGGSKPIHVDVRIISTSNRDIKKAIADKVLREDLYYRLNVVPLHLPPLRERSEDILPLAEHFLERFCQENHKIAQQLSPQAAQKLQEYAWPGNVRELANLIERAVVLNATGTIDSGELVLEQAQVPMGEGKLPVGITLRELEKRFIIETLQAQHNDRSQAAKRLGISLRTLRSKLQAYNFET